MGHGGREKGIGGRESTLKLANMFVFSHSAEFVILKVLVSISMSYFTSLQATQDKLSFPFELVLVCVSARID